MPNFPTYRGELPECLSPLKLRHYFLLAYWVFFRPTALKCYLYQADPELYRAGAGLEIFGTSNFHTLRLNFRILSVPAYRNLYAFGVVFSVVFGVASSVASSVASDVTLGVTLGVAFVVASGVGFFVASDVTSGVAFGVASGVAFGVVFSVAFGVGIGIGALRLPFYLLQIPLTSWSVFQKIKHPLAWDELVILPLPNTQRILTQQLQQNLSDGLYWIADIASNPFQRWAVQKALKAHLHKHSAPIHFLYSLLLCPNLNTYIVAPVQQTDWKQKLTTRRLLLGELDGRWVDTGNFSHLVWWLTLSLRDRDPTPVTRFAGMLYKLLDEEIVEAENFRLSRYHPIYARLTDYPGGIEIERSFEAMASFLSYDQLSALSAAVDIVSALPPEETAIRPTVLTALSRLGAIAAEIVTYQSASSRVNKLAAIARTTDNLDVLDEYVVAEVVAPEQTILQRIIRQWRKLVSEAGGKVGRAEVLAPVANPYVAGNPVIGSLFVGREDILRYLEELWMHPGQCSSVVLYGHRRMGKSSILKNLGNRFGSQTIVVDFNMQRVGLVANTNELMYNLALALYDNLAPNQQAELGEPDEERFINHNPYNAFDRFLKQVERLQLEKRFIVTVDEFELIEKLIDENRLQPELLGFWRGMIQTYPWFVIAFAGLYTLQEKCYDYWNPLFGSVTTLKVSFLSPTEARRLITQPHPDFDLDYDHAAVEQIIQLTNGQPYLIQLICQNLITRFNRQMFEEKIPRERRFTVKDVEAVISASEFYRDGNAYFTGVWNQAKDDSSPGQTAILKVLSGQDTSTFAVKMSEAEIAHQTHLRGCLKSF